MQLKQRLFGLSLVVATIASGCANQPTEAHEKKKVEADVAADSNLGNDDLANSDIGAFANDPTLPPADQLEAPTEDLGAHCGGYYKTLTTQWYQGLLGRNPDDGAAYWWVKMCYGQLTTGQAWIGIRCSAEGRARHGKGNCR